MDSFSDLLPTQAKVLLASNSPRRRELLKMIVPDFKIARMYDIDETYPADLPLERVPEYLSQLKARAYKHQLEDNEIILTADTVVISEGRILGKPHSRDEAISMLRALMGKTHTVVTGVTLTSISSYDTFSESTRVTFGTLSLPEIEGYVDCFKPMDKAGAYGIQEWIGAAAITGIEGCFYNVMGLPLHALYLHLKAFDAK